MEKITTMALIICCAILWLWNWTLMRMFQKHERQILQLQNQKQQESEQRCGHCVWRLNCPAFDTGVIYPCQHYIDQDAIESDRKREYEEEFREELSHYGTEE